MPSFYIPNAGGYGKAQNKDDSDSDSQTFTRTGKANKSGFYVPSAASYAKVYEQEEDERKRREQEQKVTERKKQEEANKKPGLLESVWGAVSQISKPIGEGGINVFANIGQSMADTARTAVKQAENSVRVQANNGSTPLVGEKLRQNQNAEIDRALKAGEIDQRRADELRKKTDVAATRTTESVKKAEQKTGVKYDQDAGALAALDTATMFTGLGLGEIGKQVFSKTYQAAAKRLGRDLTGAETKTIADNIKAKLPEEPSQKTVTTQVAQPQPTKIEVTEPIVLEKPQRMSSVSTTKVVPEELKPTTEIPIAKESIPTIKEPKTTLDNRLAAHSEMNKKLAFNSGSEYRLSMELSKAKRGLTGRSTVQELRDATKYLASNHAGKEITAAGEDAVLTGKTSFGRHEVRLADGSTKYVDADKIKAPKPTIADARDHLKSEAETYLRNREGLYGIKYDEVAPVASKAKEVAPTSQVIDIEQPAPAPQPKQSATDSTARLKQEALKYKSAEEFLKSRGDKQLHGTTKDFVAFDFNKVGTRNPDDLGYAGKGIYLTNSKQVAESFAKGRDVATPNANKQGRIVEAYLDPSSKVLEVKDFDELEDILGVPKFRDRPNGVGFEYSKVQAPLITKKAKDLGYDAIRVGNGELDKYGTKTHETAVLNPDKIHTKQQLTDLYNEAHAEAKSSAKAATKSAAKDTSESKTYKNSSKELKTAVDARLYESNPELFNTAETGRVFSEGGGTDIPSLHVNDLKRYFGHTEDIPAKYKRTTGDEDIDLLAARAGYDDVDKFVEDIQQELAARSGARESKKKLAELWNDPDLIASVQKQLDDEKAMYGSEDGFVPSKKDEKELLKAKYGEGARPIKNKESAAPEELGKNYKGNRQMRGDTVSGNALRLEQNALEKKLTDNLGDLAEYKSINMKEQADKAIKLINNDRQKAIDIIDGKANPPGNLKAQSVHQALEEIAIQDGDVSLLQKLAKSHVNRELSESAQNLRIAAERDPQSAVENIRQLQDVRKEMAEKRSGSTVKKEATKIKAEIDKVTPKATKQDWASFVKELQCR